MDSKIIKDYHDALNEMAYETCRQRSCPTAPSRLHSLYACSEQGIAYWDRIMKPKKADVFRIQVSDDSLLTNPLTLLPTVNSSSFDTGPMSPIFLYYGSWLFPLCILNILLL